MRRLVCLLTLAASAPLGAQLRQPVLANRGGAEVRVGALRFRDLNRNGTLEPYEDWRLSPERRARDLVGRMTLEEKAGAMMHGTARAIGPMGVAGAGDAYDLDANREAIARKFVTSMITRLGVSPQVMAEQGNALQAIAAETRLGIPLTISTDPRHHFQQVLGVSESPTGFSRWPETLGLAATGSPALVRQFGDIARREYRAVGIHMALSPQADLATEPRWARVTGTFGEDATRVGPLVRAYVEGFQGGASGTTRDGVLTIVKHWVGYGAAKDGWDSHSYYGRYATFPGKNLRYHITPFLGAFAARVAGVMPTYSILEDASLDGQPLEQVGAGYSHQLLTDQLRGKYGFRGVIVSDWLITGDCGPRCRDGVPAGERPTFADVGMPWGVMDLPRQARFVKAVRAGVDQFGGVDDSDVLVSAVRAGELTEARLDASVRRIMADKFRQGLFEDPYVDASTAAASVGTAAYTRIAREAQRRSLVLLENERVLPLKARARVYLHKVDPRAAEALGFTVVSDPAQADVAIVRLEAPYETLHPGYMFGTFHHEGDLGFKDGNADFEAVKKIAAVVPTVATVYLDRPAILTGLKGRVKGLVANFGVEDGVLLGMLAGQAPFTGTLPFELPSSMAAVMAQQSDVPHDGGRPLYRIGYGRRR